MKVGVVYRDECRRRIAENVSKFFEVYELKVRDIPEVLEYEIEFPEELRECGVVLSYVDNHNFNEDLVRFLDGYADFVIVCCRFRRFESNFTKVIVDDACCSIARNDNEFFRLFGFPKFRTIVEDFRIVDVEVLRTAPCGATYEVAKAVKGLSVEEALEKAGLIAQINCLGSRDAIHKAGYVHSIALENSIINHDKT